MLSRTTLSLALGIAVLLAPVAPIDVAKAFSSHPGCCVRMSAHPCHGCPMAPNSPNTTSTCCSAQAPCFVAYINSPEDFIAGMKGFAFDLLANASVTARVQRPLVPPPRSAFS